MHPNGFIFILQFFMKNKYKSQPLKENLLMKPDDSPDTLEDAARIQQAISQKAIDKKLGCAAAFEIAAELNVSPRAVGRAMDQMDYRMIQCQLGLFGHSPERKIVRPEKTIEPRLKAAIEAAAEDGRVSCLKAWHIAAQLQVSKMTVSNACEGLGIKIKPCQIGAF
jgi:hypothetical protein